MLVRELDSKLARELESSRGAIRMKHVRHEILVAMLALAVILGGGPGLAAAELGFQPDNDGYKQVVVPFFRKHCAECHVGEKPEGEFSIAKKELGTDFANVVYRGKWREIVNVLNSHEMPPEDKPQPDATEAAAVVDWITKQAVAAEVAKREQSVVLRRLNRAEYKNTVRDLVGIDFDTSVFPQDPPAGGFDNNGGALTMSPMQIEQYLSAADQILDQALVEGKQPETIRWKFDPVPKSNDSNRVRLDPKNNPIVNGGNNAYEGDWVVVHHESWDKTINARDFRVPQPGTYIVRARVAGKRPSRDDVVKSAAAILKKRQDEQNAKQPERAAQNQAQYENELKHFSVDPMYDYGPARLKLVVQLGSQPRTVAAFDVDGKPDKPQIVEFPVRFTTESAGVTLSYAYDIPKVLENFWLQGKDEFARPEAMIDWLELEGPIYDAWPPSSHTKILFDSPLKSENLNDYVRAVLQRFMSEAYRRPVTKEEVDEKFDLYVAAANGKKVVRREGQGAADCGAHQSQLPLPCGGPSGELHRTAHRSRTGYATVVLPLVESARCRTAAARRHGQAHQPQDPPGTGRSDACRSKGRCPREELRRAVAGAAGGGGESARARPLPAV
jgi:Arc/MetJ-type ribon-helix-helix transcriptional regulator